MRNITVKQIVDDLGFGLSDMLELITRKEYGRLFGRHEHHLSAGALMIALALLISISRMR